MYKSNYALTTRFFQNGFVTNHKFKDVLSQSYFNVAFNLSPPPPLKKKFITILSFRNMNLSPSIDTESTETLSYFKVCIKKRQKIVPSHDLQNLSQVLNL